MREMACIVQAASGNLAAEVQGEAVILQLTTGEYYGLNRVGARIWQLIQQPISLRSLVDSIEAEYEADRQTLETDILRVLSELQVAGLAGVVPEQQIQT